MEQFLLAKLPVSTGWHPVHNDELFRECAPVVYGEQPLMQKMRATLRSDCNVEGHVMSELKQTCECDYSRKCEDVLPPIQVKCVQRASLFP